MIKYSKEKISSHCNNNKNQLTVSVCLDSVYADKLQPCEQK